MPFHLGHLELALAALDRCVFLWIGLVGPVPGTRPGSSARLLSPEQPLTYHERQFMITRTLVAEGVPQQRFGCVPFPLAAPLSLPYFLDPGVTCFVPAGEAAEETGTLLERAGFPVEILDSQRSGEESASIRALLQGGDPAWRRTVPRSVTAYLEEIELSQRMRELQGGA